MACREAGFAADDVDVLWVPGAFELGVAVTAAVHNGGYAAVVALGAVVRGETPHFDVIVRETSAALGRAATDSLMPVGFGLLTCDTMDQAMARAGGTSGNKGREAAEAALRTADLIRQALGEVMLRDEVAPPGPHAAAAVRRRDLGSRRYRRRPRIAWRS